GPLEVEKLKLQIARLRRMQFGRSSEKIARTIEQTPHVGLKRCNTKKARATKDRARSGPVLSVGLRFQTGFPVCALCCKTRRMADSNVVIRKKRSPGGKLQSSVFRLELEWQQDIDE